jgi:hypothetical protein
VTIVLVVIDTYLVVSNFKQETIFPDHRNRVIIGYLAGRVLG